MKDICELEGVEDFESYVGELEENMLPNKVIQKLIHYTKEQGWDDAKIIEFLLYLTKE